MKKVFLVLLIFASNSFSQNLNVNNFHNYNLIRNSILNGDINTELSLNIKPINSVEFGNLFHDQHKFIISSKNKKFTIKSLGIEHFIEYNSHHPYNRNNGSMIPNRGYQHVFSPGLFFKIGPLTIKLKPEHHFSQNKNFEGFWDNHYPEVWKQRYQLWNHIDMPERFGNREFNNIKLGQSSIRLNWKKISIGISNENLWWGPARRNSIMLSNHAEGFKHITFNTTSPIKTLIGNFEWQLITGKLENSGFAPPRTDYEYAGRKLYIPKINQNGETNDWRFLQAFILSYSPKWIDGLSLGFIRWTQMYSALIEGRYWWLDGRTSYFPVFNNLFRKNDKYENYEAQTNQAAGIFFKWLWKDSKAEIYAEFYHNDSKQNLRDLILDADHSRAATIGLQKLFNIGDSKYVFGWEWTQMEQNASRLVRNAGSWYEHAWVYDGYTNKGEVLGSSIGPGSNSHYISIDKFEFKKAIGIALEIVDNDNDFYHTAFSTAKDFRRYWKDINFHVNFNKRFDNLSISSNLVFIRSLNYQWELDDTVEPYYHPGRDVNNFHFNLKLTYFGSW